jgi:transposase
MAKPYGDDLRRKFLLAYDQGEDTLEELAGRFLVSVGWAKKISTQRNRTGQAERLPHQSGRKLRAGIDAQCQVMDWVASKPDLMLAQLQAKLHSDDGISLSLGRIWHLLKKLGLRLKKSHSTQSMDPNEFGWKDIVRVDPMTVTRIIVKFEGFPGRYVWHCHMLEHEDNEMMWPYIILPA